MESAVTDLPEPDSPTRAKRAAPLQREGDAGDGGRRGGVRAERDGEVADVEERVRH